MYVASKFIWLIRKCLQWLYTLSLCIEWLKCSNCTVKSSNTTVCDEDIFSFVTWFGFTLWQLPILLKPSLLKFSLFPIVFSSICHKSKLLHHSPSNHIHSKELISVTFNIRYSKIIIIQMKCSCKLRREGIFLSPILLLHHEVPEGILTAFGLSTVGSGDGAVAHWGSGDRLLLSSLV